MIRRCLACSGEIRPGATVALLTLTEDIVAGALNVSADLGPVESAAPGQAVAHVPHTSAAVDAVGRDWQRRRRRR